MNVEKYIENERTKIKTKVDALRHEANEAFEDWQISGNMRAEKKYNRLEDEANKLEAFINPRMSDSPHYLRQNRELKDEVERLNMLLKSVENVAKDLEQDFSDSAELKHLKEIVSEWKWH